MQHSSLLLIAAFSLLAARLPAAEEVDPAMAVLKRMREQLRTVMIQQQKTEADRATLQAANVELEAKVKTQETNFKKLAKDSNEQKDSDAKTIADILLFILQQEREQARTLLREERYDRAFAEWSSELRAVAYVELREPPP